MAYTGKENFGGGLNTILPENTFEFVDIENVHNFANIVLGRFPPGKFEIPTLKM